MSDDTMNRISVDDLRQAPLFASLPDEQLSWLTGWLDGCSSEIRLQAGETLYPEGSAAQSFYIMLEGELQITRRVGGDEMALGRRVAGEFTGEMALLLGAPHQDTARAVRPCRLLQIGADDFHEAIGPVAGVMFTAMSQRIKTSDALLWQREKLAALGKLSAGFAHELNNPAAAARRASAQLRQNFQELETLTWSFNKLTTEQLNVLSNLQCELSNRSTAEDPLDLIARSDREDELQDWLNAHGVKDAWKIAPVMATHRVDVEWLERIAQEVGVEHISTVAPWIEGTLSISSMLEEIEQSTTRISELVNALKSYTYMDQAPIKEVDVHEGLESTLIILRHRLKGGVEVIREYDRSLPPICAYGSELNQVWTNLIDNAIDAMEGHGKLRVRTSLDYDQKHIIVEIEDNGPGIPPELQSLIFEPFFTTKGVGVGAGMGLDICYQIVTNHHHGDILLSSQLGDTRFQVRLPIEPPA